MLTLADLSKKSHLTKLICNITIPAIIIREALLAEGSSDDFKGYHDEACTLVVRGPDL